MPARDRRSRVLAAAALAAAIALLLLPSGALSGGGKRPPEISPLRGIAEWYNEAKGVRFTVRVEHARKVVIRYRGHGKRAQRKKFLRVWWETGFKSAPQHRVCYRLKVIASNKAGKVDRRLKACTRAAGG